jgi:hypothetical protein
VKRSSGYTVVEIMVALLVAINLMVVLWRVFSADQKRFSTDQSRLTALQGALLFEEYLRRDLDRLAVSLPDATEVTGGTVPPFSLNRPVEIGNLGRTLTFRILDPDRVLEGGTREVSYQVDAVRSQIVRREGDDGRTLPTILVEDLRFGLIALRPRPRSILPTWSDPLEPYPIHLLKFQVTCFSEAEKQRPELGGRHERSTLAAAIPLRHRLDRLHHDHWMPSAYDLTGDIAP